MAHHDAWTASFPQLSPALGTTLFSPFLRLGNRRWFQQQEDNQMTDSGPFPHNQNFCQILNLCVDYKAELQFHLQEGVFIWMLSAAHSPEGCGRKKSAHLCVGLLKQDVADSASQICHYIFPFIFLGRFPNLCRSPRTRRRKRTLFLLLQQRKVVCWTREKIVCCTREVCAVLEKLLPYCSTCHWN